MEEKFLKEILDVVVDIKTKQKVMEEKVDKIATEQQEMKQVQNIMCENIKYLLAEQADTKNIIIELVNKVGEMDSSTNKAKIYQFPRKK